MKYFLRINRISTQRIFYFGIPALIIGVYSINFLLAVVGISIIVTSFKHRRIALFPSTISRFAGALFIYTILLTAVCSVGSLFSKDFPLTLSPLITLVTIILSFIIYRHVSPKEQLTTPTAPLSIEVASLGITLAALLLLILPPFFKYGIEGGVLSQMNANVDDSVHLAMINDRIHFDQDYYLDDSPQTVRAEDKVSYPATWHSANAVLIDAAVPNITTGFQTLVAYVISKLLWVAILVYFLARLTLVRFAQKDITKVAFYFGCGLLLLLSYIAALSQSLFGFYNFIPQLIALLIISSLVFGSSHLQRRDALLIGTFAVIGGGMAWFLLLPVMTVALAVVLAASFKNNRIRESLTAIGQSLRAYPILYLILIAAMLQQIYIATLSSESISFIENIILAGEVARYSLPFFIIMAIGLLAYLFLFDKKKDVDLGPSLWTTATLILFAGGILAICLVKTGEPQYYYFKVISAIVIVLIPLCTAGFVKLFQLLNNKIDRSLQWPIGAIVLSVIAINLFPNFSSTGNILSFIKGERPSTVSSTISVLNNLQPQSSYGTGIDYKIYYDYRSFPQSFINTMLVKSNQPDSPCFRESLNKLVSDNSALSIAIAAAKNCRNQPISVVVPAREYQVIQGIFSQSQIPPNVTVISE